MRVFVCVYTRAPQCWSCMHDNMHGLRVVSILLLAARLQVCTQLDRASSMQQTDLSVNYLPSLPASSQHLSHQGSQSQQFCTVYMRVRVRIVFTIYFRHTHSTCSSIYSHVPVYLLQVYIVVVVVVYTGIYRCTLYTITVR